MHRLNLICHGILSNDNWNHQAVEETDSERDENKQKYYSEISSTEKYI